MSSNLSEVFASANEKRAKPYGKPIRVKVIAATALDHPITYHHRGAGEDRTMWVAGVADNTKHAKMLIYDGEVMKKIKERSTIMVINALTKREDQLLVVSVTAYTKIRATNDIEIAAEMEKAATLLVHPEDSAVVQLEHLYAEHSKALVSVIGKITQEDLEKHVMVNSIPTPIKEVILTDGSGSTKLTLWREMIHQSPKMGEWCKFTNCQINDYRNERSLSSTNRTLFVPTEEPTQEKEVTIIACEVEDEKVTLVLENGEEVSADKTLVCDALQIDSDNVVDQIVERLPMRLQVLMQNLTVQEMLLL